MELAMIHPKDFFIIYLQVKLEFECWFIQSPGAIMTSYPTHMQDHVSVFLCAFSFLLSLVFLFSLQLLLLGGLLLFYMLGIILHFLHLGSVCYFLFLCVCYIQCSSSDFSVKIVFYCLALLCFIMFCIQYNTSLLCHMLSYSCVTSHNRMTHHLIHRYST